MTAVYVPIGVRLVDLANSACRKKGSSFKMVFLLDLFEPDLHFERCIARALSVAIEAEPSASDNAYTS